MDLTDKTILVTGASGSIGQQLLYEFSRRDIRPIAHVRESSDTSYIDSLGLEKRTADLRNQEQLDALVTGVDAVIHTAAWVSFRGDRLTQFPGINTFGAINMFQAAVKAGVRRFVHLSSVAAVGGLPRKSELNGSKPEVDQLVRENTPYNLGHLKIPYFQTKRAAEEELLKLAKDSATELVIVNPSIVVSPSSKGDDYQRAAKYVNKWIVPSLHNIMNLVDIRDVAPGVIGALEYGRPNERYILAGDNISARDLLLALSVYTGKMPHVMHIPRLFINYVTRSLYYLQRLTGRSKVTIYPDLVRLLDYDWAYSYRKAHEELGYNARSIHVTLSDLISDKFLGTYLRPANHVKPKIMAK